MLLLKKMFSFSKYTILIPCNIVIFCYNIIIKGNRHRVVDRMRIVKTFPTVKYREGFLR